MHEQAGWPESKKAGWLEDDTPPADAMKAIQRAHAKGTRSIGIVGHGPSLEALLTFMLTGKQGNASNLHLKKGGAAVVDYHGAPGNADLHELLTRKDIARRGKA
jgi:phosphohistidine phosphatase SixA